MTERSRELRHSKLVTIYLSLTTHKLHSEWVGARSASRLKVRDVGLGVSSGQVHKST